jgi:cysteinyl-tRNA synthetase
MENDAMLKLHNTASQQLETFKPVNPQKVSVFTCGPSIYRRAHIGNFRTFLYEDVVVRYLEYLGYTVERGMNITDLEDKALLEAKKQGRPLHEITKENIGQFVEEMALLRIKHPDHLANASDHVDDAAALIQTLIDKGFAYWHDGNVYYDALKFADFGKIANLDLSDWPEETRRFHLDNYPPNRWNKGDFILWYGEKKAAGIDWETSLGRGRPAWNVQDASIIVGTMDEPLSIYCGGVDNLVRHHDYSVAIIEAARDYEMARYWLHGGHLLSNGHKMAKSLGNEYYTSTLLDMGYSAEEIRFVVINYPYRQELDFSLELMAQSSERLRAFRAQASALREAAKNAAAQSPAPKASLLTAFETHMNEDLNVQAAFAALEQELAGMHPAALSASEAAGAVAALEKIDTVLQVIF